MELTPGRGGKLARAAGTSAVLVSKGASRGPADCWLAIIRLLGCAMWLFMR